MKLLITGGRGMLGRDLQRRWGAEHRLSVCARPEHDITRPGDFARQLAEVRPDAVVHCAAATDVDGCERDPERAFAVNADGSGTVARACAEAGVRLIAISTDYVFGGGAAAPYPESARTEPATVYGRSKLAGEEAIRRACPNHLICRTAWLYGPDGPSFVHTMLKLAASGRPELKVVDDQRGNPTSTAALADHLALLLVRPELTGTVHLSCEGEATWYEFAVRIFAEAGVKQVVRPCTTAEFPRPAPRPADSRLDKAMLKTWRLPPMPRWDAALRQFLVKEKDRHPELFPQ